MPAAWSPPTRGKEGMDWSHIASTILTCLGCARPGSLAQARGRQENQAGASRASILGGDLRGPSMKP